MALICKWVGEGSTIDLAHSLASLPWDVSSIRYANTCASFLAQGSAIISWHWTQSIASFWQLKSFLPPWPCRLEFSAGSVFQKQSRKFVYPHRNVKLTKLKAYSESKAKSMRSWIMLQWLRETPCTCVHVLSALATGHLKWACQPQIGQTPVLQVFKQIAEIERTLLAPVPSNSLLRVLHIARKYRAALCGVLSVAVLCRNAPL